MYTDEDLNSAVDSGILTKHDVHNFRQHVAAQHHTLAVDEENFRLISGFNDVFVVIASGLLLASVAWLGFEIEPLLGALGFAAVSWGLAEFFVKRRRMALPAIGLLLAFLAGVFAAPIVFQDKPNELNFIVAGLLTIIAAWAHWRRFMVPITVAAATAAGLVCLLAAVVYLFPVTKFYVIELAFFAGLLTFGLAMYWDASDRSRQTRRSDVAFWLHLLSAPMIVHPIFSHLGILQGVESLSASLLVVALYVLLALISIAVDRRAIMVSALVYVLYAFSSLFNQYGLVSYSFALTGLCIGGTLLLLSAFWQSSRVAILRLVPRAIQLHLPELKA